MTKPISRRLFLGTSLSALASAALADGPLTALRPQARPGAATEPAFAPTKRPVARTTVADIIADAGLGGVVGFAVADARTGRIIEAGDAGVPLPPASVTKSITAMYALESLGADHRFATTLIATGPVEGGVVQGDLVLSGGGDPVLTTDHLAALAADLRAAGITGVTGAFRVWGGALPYLREIEPGQLDHLGYNPAVSGLNLNFNRVHFEWARSGSSYDVSMDARSATLRPVVAVSRMRVVDRSLPVYTYADGDGFDDWTVARAALGDSGSRWLPVRRPALYAGDVFRTLAAAQGLRLPRPVEVTALPDGREVARHESDRLDVLIRDMLLYSTNLTAEILGLSASRERTGTVPVSLAASAAEMVAWLHQSKGGEAEFVDHSGLSDASHISAVEMVGALVAAGASGPLRPLLKTITLTDANGDALREARGAVVAKTGTLNFVSTLAGYIRTDGGADLAFAIFCANEDEREAAKALENEIPQGARGWNGRAKRLQQRLLQRWGLIYAHPPEVVGLYDD